MFISSHLCALKLGPASVQWNEGTQRRLAKMTSVLSQIKSIKMMGLEDAVTEYMRTARHAEIKDSFPQRIVITIMTALRRCNQYA